MFTTRNVVLGVIAVTVLSLAWGCWIVLRPPDSGGKAGDTYGVRRHGLRALFDTLHELGVRVDRGLAPPSVMAHQDVTLVFWKPNNGLVRREPSYLHNIGDWLHAGGHVVVAPSNPQDALEQLFEMDVPTAHSENLFQALRCPDLDLSLIDLTNLTQAANQAPEQLDPQKKKPVEQTESASSRARRLSGMSEDVRLLRGIMAGERDWQQSRAIDVKCVGSLSRLAASVKTLEVPDERLQVLDVGNSDPQGRITFVDPTGTEQTLAAAYKIDKGELIVVAPPVLGENRLIAQRDNCVLLTDLLAGSGRSVVFDEFYHGLTVRGNPLWLFTRRGFSLVTICLLLLLGLIIWREAIFLGPPLADPFTSRRSIGEYVVAMAAFLNRGRATRRFVLEEVRSGVLHAVRRELGLPAGREEVEDLAAVLARRNPQRATKLIDAVMRIDQALAANTTITEKDTVRLLQGISSCL